MGFLREIRRLSVSSPVASPELLLDVNSSTVQIFFLRPIRRFLLLPPELPAHIRTLFFLSFSSPFEPTKDSSASVPLAEPFARKVLSLLSFFFLNP
jgi:hypothetical protein